MINCVIAEHILTDVQLPPQITKAPVHQQGYALAAHLLQYNEQHFTENTPEHFIEAVLDDDTGAVLEYWHLIKSDKYKRIWVHTFANELGRLFQGIRDIPGTDTCFFIRKSQAPKHKRATYGRICCNVRLQKEEIYCTRLTVGGNLINFSGNTSTPTADLLTAKLLINSTISTPGAVFLGIDLANFSPMADPEYMRLRLEIIPEEIIVKYNLRDLVDERDGSISKFEKACTASLKPASLPTNSSKSDCPKRDITSASTLPASGVTSGEVLFSASSSTILG
jgi:hypothetical protein